MNRHDKEALVATLLLAAITFFVIWLVEHLR